MADENLICKICGNGSGNKRYSVREMMFGIRDEFIYFACPKCGCLQIKDIPQNISKYYPPEYYSFNLPKFIRQDIHAKPVTRFLQKKRADYLLRGSDLIGAAVAYIKPPLPALAEYIRWLKACGAGLESNILDVGSGKGRIILELAWYGFKNLIGVDPYIEKDIFYGSSPKVLKQSIYDVQDTYDVVMFNHSFEHMPDQHSILKKIRSILSEKGRVLIRIPTVSSYSWKHYGTDWVALDAPRHFFLHSLRSIDSLAAEAGLVINEIEFDSTEFQFWASEQYKRDIPLMSDRSYAMDPARSIFTADDIRSFKNRAKELNAEKEGDQICVYLSKG